MIHYNHTCNYIILSLNFKIEYGDFIMWWRHEEKCRTLHGKTSKNDFNSVKKHKRNKNKFCFACKIEKYFTVEHKLLYLRLLYFDLTCKTNNYPLSNLIFKWSFTVLSHFVLTKGNDLHSSCKLNIFLESDHNA
jgi:hypothetical protein